MKHKHCELIKAWAEGAEIECRYGKSNWYSTLNPNWSADLEYRVKPKAHYAKISEMNLDYNPDVPEYAIISATTDDGKQHSLMINLQR